MINIEGLKIGIIGAVRSGIAAAKLAKRKGGIPFVSDSGTFEKLESGIAEMKKLGIRFEVGGHTDELYCSDIIVTSPGVPADAEVIKKGIAKGKKVISEIEFAFLFNEAKIIGITGTNGKTTTTSLMSHLLIEAGKKVVTAGNIGIAFSDVVDSVDADGFAVLELSSFQLDFIDTFKPDFAMLLNITPDHLNRYDNKFENYRASKFRIALNQDSSDVFVFNAADQVILRNLPQLKAQQYGFSHIEKLINGAFYKENKIYFSDAGKSEEVCSVDSLSIKGEHNLMNALAVTVVAKKLNIENEIIERAFSTFQNVEHRLEFVREINGVKFINDSKATNVFSVFYALRSFDEPIRLILGGRDKGNDYSEIEDEVVKRVTKIYAIGESAEKVHRYFSNKVNTEICDSLEAAVQRVFKDSKKGEVVLLSPACASFDMFPNYEERGKEFKRIVNDL
jgi:UDP-N-acetylmuramoylalanine--D-glutamate ligase